MFLISAPWRDEDIHSTTCRAAYEKRPYVPSSFSSGFHCIICFTNWAKSADKFLSFKFIKFVEVNKWIHLLYRIPVFVVLLKSMKMNIKNRRLSMLWKTYGTHTKHRTWVLLQISNLLKSFSFCFFNCLGILYTIYRVWIKFTPHSLPKIIRLPHPVSTSCVLFFWFHGV